MSNGSGCTCHSSPPCSWCLTHWCAGCEEFVEEELKDAEFCSACKEKQLNPNAQESKKETFMHEKLGRGFLDIKDRRQLDEAEGKTMIMVFMMEALKEEIPEEMTDFFPVAVLRKRMEAANIETSPYTTLVLGLWSKSPGEAVMWAYTLAVMTHEKGGVVTMDDFAVAFPTGLPTEEAIEKYWNEQKDPGGVELKGTDNLIDDFSLWPLVSCDGPKTGDDNV